MGVRLELADAKSPGDGNGVFLVRVAQQSERGRLRGELVSRQKPKFGEAAEWVAGRAIVGLLVLPSLV
jgi:hypothetical protein